MNKNIIEFPHLKQLEELLWRQLQKTFSRVMKDILEEMDKQIMETRDKKRFRYKKKYPMKIVSLFGEVKVNRTYYRDRETGKYVYLLDRYLDYQGERHFSPLVEAAAIDLAVKGPSYRKASEALETLLGYPVMSHEAIRQLLMEVSSVPASRLSVPRPVLFVEVDGLYVKRQGKKKKGKEEKIAAVHQGWETNGKRVRLKNKRHFIHDGKQPFWEAFEDFLVDTYEYDPTIHKLVINGDGAHWITACREHFKGRAFFCIDRFHVARDIRSICRHHPRYRQMTKALASYDGQRLLTELNSAVGTLETEEQEERLEHLISQLEKYPEALGDYRQWLQEQGINTDGMRPMGSAEATMRVFAKRLKNGRSWVDKGVRAMSTGLVACLDHLSLKTPFGQVEARMDSKQEDIRTRSYMKKIARTMNETTRDNLMYLKGKANIPVYQALKGLRGF